MKIKKILYNRYFRYLLLFIGEYAMLFIIAIINFGTTNFFEPTPGYWLPITFVSFIFINFLWSLIPIKEFGIYKVTGSLFSGAVAAFIVNLSDTHIREMELSFLHMDKIASLNKEHDTIFLFTVMFLIQLILLEFVNLLNGGSGGKSASKNSSI